MTLAGAVNKSFILLAIVVASGFFIWNQLYDPVTGYQEIPGWYYGSIALAFITSLFIIFKPNMAPLLSPFYAVLEGLSLGVLSLYFESLYSGIVMQAMLGTVCVFAALLIAYRLKIIKPTENFKLGVFAATLGIAFIYLASFIMHFFNMEMPYLHESSPMGIVVSLVFVSVASLNLVLDFDFIERGVLNKAPKHMEWYAAFGLLITVVWIYVEMLKLIAKSRD